MKFLALTLLCTFLCSASPLSAAEAEPDGPAIPQEAGAPTRSPLCIAFNGFNTLIRDGRISKAAARSELPLRLAGIRAEYYDRGGRDYSPAQWVFPVAGYNAGAIDRGGNHGFVSSGYDFFSGNRHGGHPAYDIFIHDRNQDSRDDRSGKAVGVLSMTGGTVVALETEWPQGSKLRGGKYLWVYDPANDLLVYYAHNDALFVEPGTIVRPGDLLGTVGRSGLNAAKRRSPTHLHFSVLHLKNGQPLPVPVYRDLQHAKVMP
ncbi:MAG: M23 family metallopeptidase [Desulfuromonadaceae bacterium]|nr:M23 family metallopeptidase [Desulfuromonadaceae bacterium]